MCPKVPLKTKVLLFSAVHGWIPKPFGLLVAHIGGFDIANKVGRLTPNRPVMNWITFRPYFDV